MVGCSTVGGFAVVQRFRNVGGQLTARPASTAAQLLLLTSATSLLLLPLLLLLQEAPRVVRRRRAVRIVVERQEAGPLAATKAPGVHAREAAPYLHH
jgi:hypothetical protein